MNYFNTDISTLNDYTFRRSNFSDRGIWVTLIAYCVGQENRGRIAGFDQWSEFECGQVLGIPKADLLGEHHLWTIIDGDLVLWRYPAQDQQSLERQRVANALKGKISALQRQLSRLKEDATAGSIPVQQQLQQQLNTLFIELSTLGEERRGKERRGKDKEKPAKAGALLPADIPDEDRRSRYLAIGAIMGRRETTPWSAKELAAFEAAGLTRQPPELFAEQCGCVAAYYAAPLPFLREFWQAPEADFRRRELLTLLNNWGGELDRAGKYALFRDKKSAEENRGRLGTETDSSL